MQLSYRPLAFGGSVVTVTDPCYKPSAGTAERVCSSPSALYVPESWVHGQHLNFMLVLFEMSVLSGLMKHFNLAPSRFEKMHDLENECASCWCHYKIIK